MADPRHTLGRRAEGAVAAWLEAAGWRVLATRWHSAEGELDLICYDPAGWLVGVEVRARRTGRSGTPDESVNRRHVARLRATLRAYATRSASAHRGLRIDLVSVTPAAGAVPASWRLRRIREIDAW